MNDSEVILNALQKERDELHSKIMQLDRIIKRVKSLDYSPEIQLKPKEIPAETEPMKLAPKVTNNKVLVMKIFDVIGHAIALRRIQTEFNKITGTAYQIRETVRALQHASLIKIMRDKRTTRGVLWVKTEWIVNGQLDDKYKFEGFDLLHPAENIVFE